MLLISSPCSGATADAVNHIRSSTFKARGCNIRRVSRQSCSVHRVTRVLPSKWILFLIRGSVCAVQGHMIRSSFVISWVAWDIVGGFPILWFCYILSCLLFASILYYFILRYRLICSLATWLMGSDGFPSKAYGVRWLSYMAERNPCGLESGGTVVLLAYWVSNSDILRNTSE
jgi:hypothetical protein